MALSKPLLLQFNQTFYYGCFHLNGLIQTTKYLLFFILSSAEWKKKSFHGCRFSIQSINNHLVPRSDSNPKERFDACRTFNLPILFRNKTFNHIQLSDLNVLNQYIRCCIKTNCYVLVLFDWVLNHFFFHSSSSYVKFCCSIDERLFELVAWWIHNAMHCRVVMCAWA